ncbi:hypothetical protein XCR1_1430071 [Xenorhabdus cabanillasii JM26]|uniref:Transposase n=1 Tax=Xenorhabdus cabanillasii JM26 TaxID=1427517 RepID=W1IPE3_9GAMM|nr:hypothetical protein XCR1_1430071 [Xenorhabdus cabanillasii JM26]
MPKRADIPHEYEYPLTALNSSFDNDRINLFIVIKHAVKKYV